jgi:hypothetical protein
MPFSTVDAVKVLRVTFTARSSKLAAVNWPGRVGVVRARLRAFNIVQRVQYANTYVLPLLCAVVLDSRTLSARPAPCLSRGGRHRRGQR